MSQRNSGYARKPDEAYYTPDWVAGVIADWLKKRGVPRVWDPACGNEQFANSLVARGINVAATMGDFLRQTSAPLSIVTNPPFGERGKLAEAFIRRALELQAPVVCMLLRIDFDSAKTRVDLFRDCPTFYGKIVLLDRIRWFPGESGPSDNHAWFIWDRDWIGEPRIEYAQR